MRIKDVQIHNFRSIADLCIECRPHVTLLGPNNHGKSNVLSAFEFALSTSSKPTEIDFFHHRNKGDDELWVELAFHELTEQEKTTFKRYLKSDGTIRIRKTARIHDGAVDTSYHGYTEEPTDEWLQGDRAGEYSTREQISKTPLKDLVPQSGRLSKSDVRSVQERYIADHRDSLQFKTSLEAGPLLGQKNVGGGVLPEFYLIPAIRDLTDELKIKTTTTFGRLLDRAVKEMAERDPRFAEARAQLSEVVAALNARAVADDDDNQLAMLEKGIEHELRSWGVKVSIEVTPPEIERLFELGTDISLDDGVKTKAERKGHGLQRAMMFALLRAWAKALRGTDTRRAEPELVPRKQSASLVFAMEEPELFLHPHAQRTLAASLREIADTSEHQVFICTHSTHFVDLDHYDEIAIITKDDSLLGSEIRQCTRPLFNGLDVDDRKRRFHMAHWVNPDRSEMFFAKHVILVEGETERVTLPYLAKRLQCLNPDISLIDCGSKHNLPLYIEILNAFKISYTVLHDEDPLPNPIPECWNADKLKSKQRTFDLNVEISCLVDPTLGRIEVSKPNFEEENGISKSQGNRKGKALAALDHFAAIEKARFPERLKRVVTQAYNPATPSVS